MWLFVFQNSLWDQPETRLQLKPHFCLASTLASLPPFPSDSSISGLLASDAVSLGPALGVHDGWAQVIPQ